MRVLEQIAKLTNTQPLFQKDVSNWLGAQIKSYESSFFWNGGAGFDFSPYLLTKHHMGRTFYIMSEYGTQHLQNLKHVYSELHLPKKEKTFDVNIENNWYSNILPYNMKLAIEMMVPLRFFSPDKVNQIRDDYPNFHSSVTSSSLPDDDWHGCYMSIAVFDYGEQIDQINVLYVHMENLAFYQEIISLLPSGFEVFCATRVAGKSGSWDYTHSTRGKLFQAITK